jgi:CHAD domain-containing protein
VHQARKSIRRVRATLALGASSSAAPAAVFDKELQRINRSLSPMRDGQALVEPCSVCAESAPGATTAPAQARAGAAVRRRAALARPRRRPRCDPLLNVLCRRCRCCPG